jgi:predicted transcriptional regulator
MEREQLQSASTLVVTVNSDSEFHGDVTDSLETLTESGETDATPRLSFASYDDFAETLTPRVLELIETVRSTEPASINETARVVDRDVKNVHEELTRLAQLGVVVFETEGQRKRPVVWFDELVVSFPFGPEREGTTPAAT